MHGSNIFVIVSGYTEGFQRWWECYPSYRKRGKGGAFKIWKRDGLEAKSEEIIRILQEQVDFDEQFQGKYVPMPTTYLNQNRYDDPVHKPKKSRAPRPKEPEGPHEECPYQAKINRIAFEWLWKRHGIPESLMPYFKQLVKLLGKRLREKAEIASEEELKAMADRVPPYVRKELNALIEDPPVRVEELETLVGAR